MISRILPKLPADSNATITLSPCISVGISGGSTRLDLAADGYFDELKVVESAHQ